MDISGKLLELVNSATGGNGFISIIVSVVMLVIGFVMLIKGADMFVDGASKVAVKLKVPMIVIGLTIVAFGTSAPEAAISITSACQDNAGIAVGNVIGSNIMNILIILGISALFAALSVKKTTFRYEIPFVIVITVVLLLLGLDGSISKLDAVILLLLFAVFFAYLIVLSKKGIDSGEEVEPLTEKDTVPKMILFIIIGLVAIVLGSDFTVTGATAIAEAIGVEDRIIGLTIVAFGTSLPELVTSVTAAKKNCTDIAIGNIIGSNIFNILFVVGLAGVFSPNPIGFQSSFIIDAIVALAAAVMLWVLIAKNEKLSRSGGVIMIAFYALYFVYLIVQPAILTA
ncbi:MAG: calcium/sodium antiporter [Ruminiclostridium sp.]